MALTYGDIDDIRTLSELGLSPEEIEQSIESSASVRTIRRILQEPPSCGIFKESAKDRAAKVFRLVHCAGELQDSAEYKNSDYDTKRYMVICARKLHKD